MRTPPTRYLVNGEEVSPLTAREVRDWRARVHVGRYIVKCDHGDWMLFVETVVGTDGAHDAYAFVEQFTLYREALGTARALARRDAVSP